MRRGSLNRRPLGVDWEPFPAERSFRFGRLLRFALRYGWDDDFLNEQVCLPALSSWIDWLLPIQIFLNKVQF